MKVKQVFKTIELTRTTVKNRILKVWNMVPKAERLDWYQDANDLAKEIGKMYMSNYSRKSLTEDQATMIAAGVIAALSPMKRWEANVQCAKDLIETGDCGHIGHLKTKATNIMAIGCVPYGHNTDVESKIMDILNGKKIQAFFQNIIHPNGHEYVTIDRHAISIALGKWIDDSMQNGITDIQNKFLQDCYKYAADSVGVSPLQMQAVTWVKFREIKTNYNKISRIYASEKGN
jgi:hypothetical protein